MYIMLLTGLRGLLIQSKKEVLRGCKETGYQGIRDERKESNGESERRMEEWDQGRVCTSIVCYKTISKAYQNPAGFVTKQNSMNKQIKLSYISSWPADLTKQLTDTEPIIYSVI